MASERASWLGRPRAELARALFGSPSFWSWWLEEQLFYLLLIDNFTPAGEAVRALPAELAASRTNFRDALHRVALSPSFDLRNPGADTFVTVVMEQFLGRTVQRAKGDLEAGKAAYDGRTARFLRKPAASQSDVLRIVFESRDFVKHVLRRDFARMLRREPDAKELREVTARVSSDPLEYIGVLRDWYLSPAWDSRLEALRPMPNRLFLRCLFVDLTGALPENGEVESLRGALDGLADSAPLRSVVVRSLLASTQVSLPAKEEVEDPAAWIADLFARWLGRAPDPDELRVFVEAWSSEACSTKGVAYALLSSAEYQEY